MNLQTWRTIRVRETAPPAASAPRGPLSADDADADVDVVRDGTEVAPVSFFGEIGIATPGRFRL